MHDASHSPCMDCGDTHHVSIAIGQMGHGNVRFGCTAEISKNQHTAEPLSRMTMSLRHVRNPSAWSCVGAKGKGQEKYSAEQGHNL